jgi:hypothetical protein
MFQSPLAIRTTSIASKFGGDVFFNAGRVATLRTMIEPFDSNGDISVEDARINFEWNVRVNGTVENYIPLGPINPWYIDSAYDEPVTATEQLAIVNSDASAAVDLAVKYLVTGNEYALESVVRILDAWSRINAWGDNGGSQLNWNDKWPMFIQAAMMVRHTESYTDDLDVRLKAVTLGGLNACSVLYGHNNNWSAWGCCLEIASAMFLNDRPRFDAAIIRWRNLFNSTVVNNVPVNEVTREGSGYGNGRSGLWYSNFYLSGLVISAEWARFGGEWLYDHYNVDEGSSLKNLALNIRNWTRHPETFPYNTSGEPSSTVRIMAHDEILHALWPNTDSQWLLDNFPTGSVRDNFGMRQFVLAYRDRPLYG